MEPVTCTPKTAFPFFRWFAICVTVSVAICTVVAADTREYQVKAAFVHKFTLFAEYPADVASDKSTFDICIPGDNPFGDAFAPVEGKKLNGRPLVIRPLPQDAIDHGLFICDVVYLSHQLPDSQQRRLLHQLRESPVLTIGEDARFLEMGGIIRLYRNRNRIVFSVNTAAARRAGIQFRSQMLRIADQVIDKEPQ